MFPIEVKTAADKKEFIHFPKALYKNDPHWISNLDNAVEAVFDTSRNPAFKHGEATRWILKDKNNTTIGRTGVFIDYVRSKASRQPTGGIGYFEVIEDRNAAFTLFDVAKGWLAVRGMQAMDGPINFGENDNNWGLLVDGFMQQGFGMPYHKKYYKAFFEEYGFKNYFEQYSYHKDVGNVEEFPERFKKIADWLSKRQGYSFRHFEFKDKKRYVNDLADVYNSTWSVFKEDFTPLDPDFLEASLRKARYFMDEELIWFAYYNDKPIAFFVLFPDLNQIIRHFNGRLHIWNLVKFVYFRSAHRMTRMRAVVAGVNPSFQNSGIESAIFLQLFNIFRKKTYYKELELSWVGDFNPKMMAIYEALGAVKAKTHITYRYLFSAELPFIRYKDEMADRQRRKQDSSRVE
jgi:hypothetical protein